MCISHLHKHEHSKDSKTNLTIEEIQTKEKWGKRYQLLEVRMGDLQVLKEEGIRMACWASQNNRTHGQSLANRHMPDVLLFTQLYSNQGKAAF